MRVLFDHNIPHKLRTSLGALGKHEIVTASYMGWGDLKNGELLRAAPQHPPPDPRAIALLPRANVWGYAGKTS